MPIAGDSYAFMVRFHRRDDGEPFIPTDYSVTIIDPDSVATTESGAPNNDLIAVSRTVTLEPGVYRWFGETNDPTASRSSTSIGELSVATREPLDAADTAAAVQDGLDDQGYTTARASLLDTLDGIVDTIAERVWALATASAFATGVGNWLNSTLSAVAAKVGLIELPGNFSYQLAVDPETNNFTIVRGDSYTVASGRALPTWSNPDWSVYDLENATITFRANYRAGDLVVLFTKPVTTLSATELLLQLTNLETGQFAWGNEALKYDVQAVLSGGDVVTLVRGRVKVLEDAI